MPKQSKNDPAATITGTISGHSHHTSHQGYHSSNGLGHSLQISAAMAAAAASGSNSPYHIRSTEYPYPASLYTSTIMILIVTVAIVIVIIACSFAYVYVKLEERKVNAANNCFMSNGHAGYTAIGSPTGFGGNFKWVSGYPSSQFNQVASSMSSGSSPGTVSSSCASTPGGFKGNPADEHFKSSPSTATNVQNNVVQCNARNLLKPRPPVPTFLWTSQGPISEEDSDDLASNCYATLPFDGLLLHKDQGQEQIASEAIPLNSSPTSSPSKGGPICVSAQVHPHHNNSSSSNGNNSSGSSSSRSKSAGQTMEIFVNNMYDMPCHLTPNYKLTHSVTPINDQVTNKPDVDRQGKNIPLARMEDELSSFTTGTVIDDDSHDTYSSNELDGGSVNELSWQNNLPGQASEFISTTKSHGSDSCQDELSHCMRQSEKERRISEVTMNANSSNNISSHGIGHKSFILREREVNECDINSSISGKCVSSSLLSTFNSSFVSDVPAGASAGSTSTTTSAGDLGRSKLRPQSYCFANSNLFPCDKSNLLHHQNHNQGNQKEQEDEDDQVDPRDQRALTRKSCVISAV